MHAAALPIALLAGLVILPFAASTDGPQPPSSSTAQQHRISCPPGLAKKNPPCIPPGQAAKMPRYRVGDRIMRDYALILNPEHYGLDRGETYYDVDGYVFRVDRETREVLGLIGAIAAVLD